MKPVYYLINRNENLQLKMKSNSPVGLKYGNTKINAMVALLSKVPSIAGHRFARPH